MSGVLAVLAVVVLVLAGTALLVVLAVFMGRSLSRASRRYPLVDVTISSPSPGMAAALEGRGEQFVHSSDDDDAAVEQARALLLVHFLAMRDELDELAQNDDLPDVVRNRCRHLAARADGLLT